MTSSGAVGDGMVDLRNIGGHFYPTAHPGWGAFAEELFHYTSRYYKTTEAFLASIAERPDFSMTGYRAARLSEDQRWLLAAVLADPPDRDSAQAVMDVVGAVCAGGTEIDAGVAARYRDRATESMPVDVVVHPVHFEPEGEAEVGPLDPFLNLADRLLMPVAVRDRHVEVSLRELANHLQSENSTLRVNLHNAVITLHNAGYVLRNHPHLTHCEVDEMRHRPR